MMFSVLIYFVLNNTNKCSIVNFIITMLHLTFKTNFIIDYYNVLYVLYIGLITSSLIKEHSRLSCRTQAPACCMFPSAACLEVSQPQFGEKLIILLPGKAALSA